MDSDNESFPFVDHNDPGSETWVTTEDQIRKYQEMYHSLEADRLSLERMMTENEKETVRFQEEAERLRKSLKEQEDDARSREAVLEMVLEDEQVQRSHLLQQKQELEEELEQLRISQEELKVPVSYPERAMVFKGHVEKQDRTGHTAKAEEGASDLVTTAAQVKYLVPGGSALITFEDPEVASKVIAKGQHLVQLDNVLARVTAKEVVLALPSYVKISLKQRPRQVLVSGLEAVPMNDDRLFDKVQLFFSRRQNDGDEVSCVERLSSGHLVLTFEDSEVAKRLIRRGQFEVPIGKETYEVKVSHYTDGDIADLQVHPSVCARTVLLTEIPNVLDEELIRSYLMIHFQKPSKGGGEVETVVYVPDGQSVLAVFEGEKD